MQAVSTFCQWNVELDAVAGHPDREVFG